MSANPYDQRWIKKEGAVFRSAASTVGLCSVCGDAERCNIKRALEFASNAWAVTAPVQSCGVFMPVISFRDDTGVQATFNTFRRGTAWARRAPVGTTVRLYALDIEEFVGTGKVVECHQGALGALLDDHAAFNHLLRDGNYPDAPARLQKILVALYGKNYAAPDKDFSVIYVEPEGTGVGRH